MTRGSLTRYEVELDVAPRAAWRSAFRHPPETLITATASPGLCRLNVTGNRIVFQTTPPRLHYWLRWIDRWIAYANSIIAE